MADPPADPRVRAVAEDASATSATPRRVTRDVAPAAVADLLDRPSRVTVTFARDGLPETMPGRLHVETDRYRFCVAAETAADLDGCEVVLVTDGGAYWFELRGCSIRGLAAREGACDASAVAWYTLTPRRTLAWDYATVHEE